MEIRYEIDKTIYFNNNYETDIKIVEIIDFMIDCLLIIVKNNLVYNIFEFILIEKISTCLNTSVLYYYKNKIKIMENEIFFIV